MLDFWILDGILKMLYGTLKFTVFLCFGEKWVLTHQFCSAPAVLCALERKKDITKKVQNLMDDFYHSLLSMFSGVVYLCCLWLVAVSDGWRCSVLVVVIWYCNVWGC